MNFDTPALNQFVEARLNRRTFLRNTTVLAGTTWGGHRSIYAEATPSSFNEVERGKDAYLHVPAGYRADVLIRWGDPLLADAALFDPLSQSGASQSQQFGYNNDFVAYLPLPSGSACSDHGLLCVNHEFTNARDMFPPHKYSPEQMIEVEMAAHGHSVLEVTRKSGQWRLVPRSAYSRRIDARTPISISGPAAGHIRLRTQQDPAGTTVLGTLSNCGGGVTPWGSVLSAEEHFQLYFHGNSGDGGNEVGNHLRYGVGKITAYNWSLTHPRFRIGAHPTESNRFGWVVEIDPYNPRSVPVKRTALGRFSHEAATCVHNPDGRVVVYMGDDREMEYIYRYVSRAVDRRDQPDTRDHLLDDGELSVAKFDDTGLDWIPLVFGSGPLTPAHGFHSQADVLIETRRAADLLHATPMDRPEDIETNPLTDTVFVLLTGNSNRSSATVGGPNPRQRNGAGHIIELHPPGGDHCAQRFDWRITVMCGDPNTDQSAGRYSKSTSRNGWFSSPDNCTFDNQGRIWIASDASPLAQFDNGAWIMHIDPTTREVHSRHFLRCPRGAELCGPAFTPDNATLFAAIQHPGAEPGASYDAPTTRWPDFNPLLPPRPSIVAITRTDGAMIGT